MELVQKVYDNLSSMRKIICILVVLLCIYAMFSTPSVPVAGSLPIAADSPSVLIMILTGFAIGCYGTIVGIGGGPLIMPFLILCYGWGSEFLVATSLFIVFLNALSGSIGYSRQRRIDYDGGIKFALAALPGAIISAFVHHIFNIKVFNVIFGIFLILLAVYSFLSAGKINVKPHRSKQVGQKDFRHVEFIDKFNKKFSFYSDDKLGIYMNLMLGFFVGFLGIGGGVFQVPILIFLLRYPVHVATATSHFITALTCAFALIPHIFLGNVYFLEAMWMGVGIVFGAQLGARLAPKIDSKITIYLFIIILLVFAVKLFK